MCPERPEELMHRIMRHNTCVWGAVVKCLGRPKLERPKDTSLLELAAYWHPINGGLVLLALLLARVRPEIDAFVGSELFTLSPSKERSVTLGGEDGIENDGKNLRCFCNSFVDSGSRSSPE